MDEVFYILGSQPEFPVCQHLPLFFENCFGAEREDSSYRKKPMNSLQPVPETEVPRLLYLCQ